jgi:hypothetical protein
MNDFLSRLAARTLGIAPMAKPLIASRFERPANDLRGERDPVASGPVEEPASDISQGVQLERDSQQERGSPDVATRAPAELKPTPPSPDRSSGKRLVFPVEAMESAKRPFSLLAAQEPFASREEPEVKRATDPGEPATRSPRETAPMVRQVHATTLPDEPQVSASPTTQQGLEVRSEIGRATNQRSNEGRTGRVVLSSIRPADNHPEEPEVIFHHERGAATRQREGSVDRESDYQNLATRADVHAGMHNAPEIRVTIGRVEVRAAAPPQTAPAAAKPARSGPALSLEAYLNRRNGDAR